MVTDVSSLCLAAVWHLTMCLFISTFPYSALHEQYERELCCGTSGNEIV